MNADRVSHPESETVSVPVAIRRFRIRRTVIAGLVGLLVVQGLLGGCTAVIHPPSSPSSPTTVYVVDYGMHAGLVLPTGEKRRWVEYQYGDWNYFALANNAWYNSFPALLWPTQGALGRRYVTPPPHVDSLVNHFSGKHVISLRVSDERAGQLRQTLEKMFGRNQDTKIENDIYGLTFVKVDLSYSLCFQCNDMLVHWLRELDCRVHGTAMFSSWVLSKKGAGE